MISTLSLKTFGLSSRSVWLSSIFAIHTCLVLGLTGCRGTAANTAPPLGYADDPIWQIQERNAEASDFIIYDHEFIDGTSELNEAGQDHVREIGYRAREQTQFPIVVERSQYSAKPGSEFGYPVYQNPAMDQARRALIVQALTRFGVAEAEQRTIIGTPYAPSRDPSEQFNNSLGSGGSSAAFGGFYRF